MTEFDAGSAEKAEEFEREKALDVVIDQYFPGDKEWLKEEYDFNDRLGVVYGQLLELAEDPDVILQDSGVIEKDDNEV